jgi:microcystin-dependent protein
MMRRVLGILAALVACLLLVSTTATALDEAVNRRIPYQGRLEGTTGPVTILAELYDVNTGGNLLWGPEPHVVTPDAEGRFLIVIGSTDLDLCARQPDQSLACGGGGDGLPDLDQIDASGLYLSLQVDDGATTTTLSPRQRLFPAFQAASVSPGSIAIERLAAEVANALVPTGAVLAFAGEAVNVPEGWLPCDGASLSSAAYPGLFSVIGTAHGGSGGLFQVPDYRGRFLRGVAGLLGAAADPDTTARVPMDLGGLPGNNVGSVQDHSFQSHHHVRSGGSHSHLGTANSGGTHDHQLAHNQGGTLYSVSWADGGGSSPTKIESSSGSSQGAIQVLDAGSHSHSLSTTSSTPNVSVLEPSEDSGFGPPLTSSESRPRNAYVNFIIRCGPDDAC